MSLTGKKNQSISQSALSVRFHDKQSKSYEIFIGYDILELIAKMIANSEIASSYVIISDDNVWPLYGKQLLEGLQCLSINSNVIIFPAGETSKKLQSVIEISDKLCDFGIDRHSCLIALGGGVVGDLTGFIASVYMRGIPYIQVPTSLLAQVDSSVGGKTAIDLPQGKNLLGSFWQPSSVFIDMKCLETLPSCEYQNGLAEVIKYGIIKSEAFFQKLEDGVDKLRFQNREYLEEIILTSCRIKKDIVEIDEKETSRRRILNLGHTLGHALESTSGYTISHGNAIAIGMIAITRISEKLFSLSQKDRNRIENIISSLGLATKIPEDYSTDEILSALQKDKKKAGKKINFVLLKKIGSPFVSDDVPTDLLRYTIEEMKK